VRPKETKQIASTRNFPESTECLELERHFTVREIAALWAYSIETVRQLFLHEPGVLVIGCGERLHKRSYHSIRVPESVLKSVHRKLRNRAA
jgi:hypothetical protein